MSPLSPLDLSSSEPLPRIRNLFCGKYRHCLDQAARHDLKDIDCSRCCLRDDRSGQEETRRYLSGYLQLLKVIVQGNKWMEPAQVFDLNPAPPNDIGEEHFEWLE